MKKEFCPAWLQKCKQCNGQNHFSVVCKKGKSRGIHGISEQTEQAEFYHGDNDDSCESDCKFLSVVTLKPAIHAVEQTHAREVYTEMIINGKSVNLQIDCGASIIIALISST